MSGPVIFSFLVSHASLVGFVPRIEGIVSLCFIHVGMSHGSAVDIGHRFISGISLESSGFGG